MTSRVAGLSGRLGVFAMTIWSSRVASARANRRRPPYTAASPASVNPLTWEPDRSEMLDVNGIGDDGQEGLGVFRARIGAPDLSAEDVWPSASDVPTNRICVKEVAS